MLESNEEGEKGGGPVQEELNGIRDHVILLLVEP